MHSILVKATSFLKTLAATLGGPGLLLIAFLDSSFLSFPEVNDLLIITGSFHNPERMLYYATMTLIGSVLGCVALYWVGRSGGGALLRRKFGPERIERARRWYDRYGVLAVIIPSILPPPMPFKVFVFSAGVFEISLSKFIFAVIVGRGIRYYLEGFVAMQLGEHAMDWMKAHYPIVALCLVAAVVLTYAIYMLMRRKAEDTSN
jgi:membrane protein YqaA with SNARE-associated domain